MVYKVAEIRWSFDDNFVMNCCKKMASGDCSSVQSF